MEASLEPPDGGATVERKGGAANPFDAAPCIAPEPQVRGEDADRGAGRRRRHAQIRIRHPEGSHHPALRLPGRQRDLESDDVFEQTFLAIAQLSAPRRVAGESVGSLDVWSV